MKIVKLDTEDMSGRSIVICVHKYNKFTGQTTKFSETWLLENEAAMELYLLFDVCDKCRVNGYVVLKRFGELLYSGLDFREAMKARC